MDPLPHFTCPDYKPSNKLQGKVAVITGGDFGIGQAVCNLFSLEGATVVFTYVKGDEDKDAKDTLEMIKKAKSEEAKDPLALAADLGFDENCKRDVDEVVSAYGHIDILVNNAAEQYECSSVEEIDESRLERVFRTNIFSYFFMTRHALKHMKEGSSIINKKSVNAYKGNAKLLDYTSVEEKLEGGQGKTSYRRFLSRFFTPIFLEERITLASLILLEDDDFLVNTFS